MRETTTYGQGEPSRAHRHARAFVARGRGPAAVALAVVAVVVGVGAGAAAAGPGNISVFGWNPIGRQAPAATASLAPTTPPATPSATPTPTPEPSPEDTEPDPVDPEQMAADIVAATNAQRASAKLDPLAVSPCVTAQVTERIADLVATNEFKHPPLEPLIHACTSGSGAAGENLAKGYSAGADVVDGWMDSEAHKANVLGDWTNIGVSCQLRADAQWICGAVFTHE
ncbi:MAG: CAP domain-containing protein [Micrococcales bacterium]|nr:CAP domain-containing protein [Micrococcales bacterium]